MDFDKIVARVFVGSSPLSGDDIRQLRQGCGITAVLNLQTDEDFAFWGIDWPTLERCYRECRMEVRRVPVRDFDPDDLRRRLPECVAALAELLRAGHTVYVHCSAGVNRSPSTVVAYLHWVEGWRFDEAVTHVTTHRACDPYVQSIWLATQDRAGSDQSLLDSEPHSA